MSYSRAHDFATDTVLEAGSGDPVVRLGINDEIVAAYNDVTALVPAAFAAGTFRGAYVQCPNALSVETFGCDGRVQPRVFDVAVAAQNGPPWNARRTLAAWRAPAAARIHRITFAVRAYALFARDAKVLVRLNHPFRGKRIARDLRLRRDLPRYFSVLHDQNLDQREPNKNRFRFGGEAGDSPLFVEDLAEGDRVYVTVDWSHLFLEATYPSGAGQLVVSGAAVNLYPVVPSVDGAATGQQGEWLNAAGLISASHDTQGTLFVQQAWLDRPSVSIAWSSLLEE